MKEMPFIEKRFRDAYRAWLARGAPDGVVTHLAGIHETHNAANGFSGAIQRPRLIGNKERAAQIAGIEQRLLRDSP